MNTTKIVVAFEMPNQMMAKIAQIAEETVLRTVNHRFEKFAGALIRSEQDAERQSDERRNDKAYGNPPQRDAEIVPQIAVGDDEPKRVPDPCRTGHM